MIHRYVALLMCAMFAVSSYAIGYLHGYYRDNYRKRAGR